MSVSGQLDIRQGQSLVMTPQLQQAIKLLQMSNIDLNEFVASETENNPFLETDESSVSSSSLEQSTPDDTTEKRDNGLENSYDSYEPHTSSYDASAPTHSLAETVPDKPSLREHILRQIHIDFGEPAERMIAVALVEFIDEAGYLPADLELVRTQMGVMPALFNAIIERLQKLEPAGIFARSLRECLAIQLRDKNRLDPAMEALLDNLELLAKRERTALLKKCGVDAEDLTEMVAEIRALDPKPALAFSGDAAPPITPDVMLVPLPNGGWHVELNNETLPRVLVNEEFYTKVIKGAREEEDKSYLSERFQQANWLVKALHQRATTILKVATEIVKMQDKFFLHGVQHLKPLILKDIADIIEMHESTVSRVTQNKYMATPRGLFELKYFFSGSLQSTGGTESISTVAVRERIKELVAMETDAKSVLSDDKLTAKLKSEGIDIARRTVAKYRESLGIPSSAQRKREIKSKL